ncbi:unnamed protein product [Linum tenue]|uniref:Uncharacterized protein n=1 Tax=Linum tenue TaxID=586396 RepID=A0AAV0IBM1_9ROSI|nr:unnamed protein product [Linum tenue]
MSTQPPPPLPLDFSAVLSESKRIINAHSRHFLALSVLFLLPLSFSVTVFSTIHNLLLHHHSGHRPKSLLSRPPPLLPSLAQLNSQSSDQFNFPRHHHHHHHDDDDLQLPIETLALVACFALFFFVFTILAIGSISYSVLHGFYGRPVKFVSAIKSGLTSFFRLFITHIVVELLLSLVALLFLCSFYFVIKGLDLVCLEIDTDSPYFLALAVVYSVVLLAVLLYFKVNWSISSVIVVAESSWGVPALRRSGYLVKGMRRAVLYFFLSFGLVSGILTWTSSIAAAKLGGDALGGSQGWNSWFFVAQIVVTSALLTLILLYFFAAQTVLYMYCKAVRGELASEIAQEFAREYVCLPFDDEKVPHLVSVVYT